MVGVFAHSGGSFKPATSIPVNTGGTWQNAQEVWAKDNGVWTKVFPAEVREPASGENYSRSGQTTLWMRDVVQNRTILYWLGSVVYDGNPGSEIVSFSSGGWSYYRGSLRESSGNWRYFAIYRIGTP